MDIISVVDPPPAASTSNSLPENVMYKNRLQEYAQRACLPLPVYKTVNEGHPHLPNFRSTVLVDGKEFSSQNAFLHRKEAEQDVARLALDSIKEKIVDEGSSFVSEDTTFCKSILNEYAAKMRLEKPTYKTVKQEAVLPYFVSSLVFNGVTYTGNAGRNKKEAEQLTARTAIMSLLGNAESSKTISNYVKSKRNLYAALRKLNPQDVQHSNVPMTGNNTVTEAILANDAMPIGTVQEVSSVMHTPTGAVHEAASVMHTQTGAVHEASSVMHTPRHIFTKPNSEVSDAVELPMTFVHPSVEQSMAANPISKKRKRKNKKKANKRMQIESQ
ncbi:double-stranded RNA-binding protein 4-like [Mercurialis annua]|uniref:double-stranded RNA-binding protein 4-like n=1 Tax=Mercurialis annua TaxID=3986 RepID=UPI00215F7173|nr:double-stranded RNA-binding protein 4-like [Mercurialis annua]